MSEQDKQSQQNAEEPHTENDEEFDPEHQEQEDDEETYKNNHDLIGVEGIIRAQKNEIEKKKVLTINRSDSNVARTENRKRKVLQTAPRTELNDPALYLQGPRRTPRKRPRLRRMVLRPRRTPRSRQEVHR